MDSAVDDARLRAALAETLCSDEAVDFAVVFGSRVSDEAGPSSDLDVAVKFSESLTPHERFRRRCYFAGELQRTDGPFVDVTDLDALPLAVAHDAVTGEFLCGDEASYHRFKADVEATYEREREELDRHRRDVINRIAEDGLHG